MACVYMTMPEGVLVVNEYDDFLCGVRRHEPRTRTSATLEARPQPVAIFSSFETNCGCLFIHGHVFTQRCYYYPLNLRSITGALMKPPSPVGGAAGPEETLVQLAGTVGRSG